MVSAIAVLKGDSKVKHREARPANGMGQDLVLTLRL